MGGIGRWAAVVCDCWPRMQDFSAEIDYHAHCEFDQDGYCDCLDNSSYVHEYMAASWYALSELGQAFHRLFCSGQPRRHAHDLTPPAPANEEQQLPVIPYYVEDNYPTLLKVTDESSYRKASRAGNKLEIMPNDAAAFHTELERLRVDLDGQGGLDSACLEALWQPRRRSIQVRPTPNWTLVDRDDEDVEPCRQWLLAACEMCVERAFRLRFSF